MIKVNAIGDTCPVPLIKTKKAIEKLNGTGQVEILVDDEIAVQNLTKMAVQKKYAVKSTKLDDGTYQVLMSVGQDITEVDEIKEINCNIDNNQETVVVISSKYMGDGEEELGKVLMKGFIYSLTQLDILPTTIIFYNSGAFITCEESEQLEDLKYLENQGVEILTCGTCMNYYNLEDNLKVGSVTNMYVICEKMISAGKVVKP